MSYITSKIIDVKSINKKYDLVQVKEKFIGIVTKNYFKKMDLCVVVPDEDTYIPESIDYIDPYDIDSSILSSFPNLSVIFKPVENLNIYDPLNEPNIEFLDDEIKESSYFKIKNNLPPTIPPFPNYMDVNNNKNVFKDFKNVSFEMTEMVSGAPFILYYIDNQFGVCTPKYEIDQNYPNVYSYVIAKYKLKDKIKKISKMKNNGNIVLYGYVYGMIDDNYYNMITYGYSIIQCGKFYNHSKFLDFKSPHKTRTICNNFDLNYVNVIEYSINTFEQFQNVEELQNFVKTLKSKWNNKIPVLGVLCKTVPTNGTVTGYYYKNPLSERQVNVDSLIREGNNNGNGCE